MQPIWSPLDRHCSPLILRLMPPMHQPHAHPASAHTWWLTTCYRPFLQAFVLFRFVFYFFCTFRSSYIFLNWNDYFEYLSAESNFNGFFAIVLLRCSQSSGGCQDPSAFWCTACSRQILYSANADCTAADCRLLSDRVVHKTSTLRY